MNGDIEIKSEKEKFWEAHIAAWGGSELSQVSYCREQQISCYAFRYWRSRFNRRLKSSETGQNHFVKISPPVQSSRNQPIIQMVLPNGVRIGIDAAASAQMLREVLSVVSSC